MLIDLPGAPGSVTQVRDRAYRLVQQAKERELATVLIGHLTKEGTLAGAVCALEHVVDTVLSVDGYAATCCASCTRRSTGSAAPTSSACSR